MKSYTKNIKITTQSILLSLLIPMIIGCSKEKQIIIENNWQVESIKVHADSALQYPAQGKIYTLTFEDKKSYVLKLDINKCSGKVKFKSNNSIDFTDTECTEICCDSDFAKNIVYILTEVEKYQLTDSTLILSTKNNKVINLKE